ncbi:MAG: tRNA-dihydrouridine synthase [Desulfarculales bacterium]|jgi:nifR3 family TIM-barrel protein|nr:tRNA-dihydrouridine synthase [Desulfarculales bacterium]
MLLAGLELISPFVAAPLAGVSNLPFRLTLKKGGASLVYSEMISSAGLIRQQPQTLRLTRTLEEEAPLALQLFGADPAAMGKAAAWARKRGYGLLDINMGCPVRKVRRQGAGSALLDTPDLARQVLEAAAQGFGQAVTVKIRLGYKHNDLERIMSFLEDAPLAAICLHARTVAQGYGGRACWPAIAWLKKRAAVPVVGNGDVKSADDAVAMLAQTGCDGVMIGRAALADPYIFARARALREGHAFPEPSLEEIRLDLHAQASLALRLDGPGLALHLVRQFIMWRGGGKPGIGALRRRAGMCKDLSELLRLADNFFYAPEKLCA